MKNIKDMKIESTYPAYDDWLSKNMSELKKSVEHLPAEETADIIEVAGRMIWLAAQQQEGYVMVPEGYLETLCAYGEQYHKEYDIEDLREAVVAVQPMITESQK